jgi:type I restriction enzyme S subunit
VRTVPLRRIAAVVNGGTPTADASNWGGEVPWATPVDLGRHDGSAIRVTERTLTDRGLETGSAVVPAGSIILSTRAPIGYVCVNQVAMAFNQGCRGLVPRPFVSSEYLRYVLLHLRPYLQAAGTGSTFMELSTGALASMPIPVVGDRGHQDAVVDFLDRETAKIDALIATQEHLLDLLNERADAMRKVWTIGRSTGVRSARIGQVLMRLERLPREPAPIVTAYRDGQVTSRESRREEGYTLSFTEHGYQGVEAGDLVFHGLDGFAGAVGVAELSGKCSPVYHVCRAREGHDAEYLAHHIRALGVSGMLEKFAWSVRQRSADYRNWALFAALPIATPSLGEQREAANEIRRANERASALRTAAKTCIDLLRERRSALITAAVTGRLDVTTYGKAG